MVYVREMAANVLKIGYFSCKSVRHRKAAKILVKSSNLKHS